ncbi:C40 family peptidase [Clostridium sp. 19966]|uniref:bulb-type lectin domain-containing protein n=1 Tax=Clostridium sp. 19966 TaxID=2768166 RepID=UPI0028E01CEA|nr:bulb-type lectin domain-containing protein [Clostridium sp. 19966]MDT8716167.1 C40 family peptidase [Clostridium sp. 19966]
MKKTIYKNLTKIIKASALMAIIILMTCGKLPAVTTLADTANVANCLGNELKAGQILQFNQYLKSDDGDYTASLQQNGNLTVYNKDKTVKFNIETGNNPNLDSYKIIMQNGNLAISNNSNVTIWNTQLNQTTSNQASLKLDNQGNLQIVNNNIVVWQNNQVVPQSIGSKLNMGQSINTNQYLASDNGNYTARIQQDGNFVVYDNYKAIWATYKFSSKASNSNILIMQSDGNLVAYDGESKALWSSETTKAKGNNFSLQLDNDGYLSVLADGNTIWNNKIGKFGSIGNTLLMGQTMWTQQYLTSEDGKYNAAITGNGNLVVSDKDGNTKWSTNNSNANGFTDNRLAMQVDGNVVIYGSGWNSLWNSQTDTNQGAKFYLKLDNCGVLRIFSNDKMIWSNDSGKAGSIGSVLKSGETMWTEQYLTSDNGEYTFHIEPSGKLVIYDKNRKEVWTSNNNSTTDFVDNRLSMQKDGNLVLYGRNWDALWQSQTNGTQNALLSMKLSNEGYLCIIADDKIIWDSIGYKFENIGSKLSMGQTIWLNQYLSSENGNYTAHLEKDGTFNIYDKGNNKIWTSNKLGDSNFISNRLSLQNDGNLVVYGEGWNIIWNSGTDKAQGSLFSLTLDDDGELRLLSDNTIIWDSSRGKVGSIGDRLEVGQTMYTTQYLTSYNGEYTLRIQQDGNLVIYDKNNNPVWATYSYSDKNFTDNKLVLSENGNLTVTGQNSQVLWQSATGKVTNNSFYLKLDNNGDLRLFENNNMIWNSNGGKIQSIGNSLKSGQTIWTTQYLMSENEKYRLIIQDDGNLVIYDNNNKPIWAAYSFGSSDFTDNRLSLQSDGNLVVYGDKWNSLWYTKTDHTNNNSLLLRLDDDGDLRLFADSKLIWDSNRGKVGSIGSELNMGQVMWTTQYLVSDDGKYTLNLQGDGNLVIYDQKHNAVWASYRLNNTGFTDNRLSIQNDGNLVVYGNDWNCLWNSSTNQGGGHKFSLKLGDNGCLYIVKDGYWIWASDTVINRRVQVDVYATKYLGCPYLWGGTGSPLTQADINMNRGTDHDLTGMEKYIGMQAFDCSGFVQYVYKNFGYNLGRTTYDQIYNGVDVHKNALQPGDILFFGDYSAPHHEAIYLGNGLLIEAPESRAFVQIVQLSSKDDFCRARRII